MKEIELTQGFTAKVDDENFDYLNQWKWYALKNKKTFYAQRTHLVNGRNCAIKMHRVIMNAPKGMEVDHKDHNGLNNQKENIRICTFNQNRKNRSAWGRSKYLGVSYRNNKPYAQIKINGVAVALGKTETEEAAALLYNEAALLYHGEFANLNQIKK